LREGKGYIICEGLVKNTKCVNEFRSDAEKRYHEENVYSVNCGKKCNHYRSLSVLYERGILA
jgi:hypothetical protein